jgi:hypothetical protein
VVLGNGTVGSGAVERGGDLSRDTFEEAIK